jgi:hypothetical protein
MKHVVLIVALAFGSAPSVLAQREVMFAEPSQRLDEASSEISQAVVLQDGRVLILDRVESAVYAVTPDLQERKVFAREGSGPGEVRAAERLLRHPDGRVYITDIANTRIVAFSSDGAPIADPLWTGAVTCPAGRPISATMVTAVDAKNRFFSIAPPIRTLADGSREIVNQSAVLAWGTRCRADTVAYVPAVIPAEPTLVGNAVVSRSREPHRPIPFEARPQWTLTSDGRVAVVTPEPYEVQVYKDGARVSSTSVPHAPVAVSEAHKARWRTEAAAPQRAIMLSRDGSVNVTRRARAVTEPDRWPSTLPPFLASALLTGPDGSVWIRRTTAVGARAQYDVIGGDGEPALRVSFPANVRVVALSATGIFAVEKDEDDLEYLVRYPWERLQRG